MTDLLWLSEALFTSFVEALMFSLCSSLRGFPWITCNSSS